MAQIAEDRARRHAPAGELHGIRAVGNEGRAARVSRCSASATRPRTSLTPVSTAENGVKCAFAWPASREASVVFPVPGGPQRIIE